MRPHMRRRSGCRTRRQPFQLQHKKSLAIGAAFVSHGLMGNAIAVYREIIALDPKNVEANYCLGVTLAATGAIADGEKQLRLALDFGPTVPPAYNALGRFLLLQFRLEEAEANLRRALIFDPSFELALSNLGVVLALREDMASAERVLSRALAIDSSLLEATRHLAVALINRGRLGEAEACYRRLLVRKPDDVPTLTGLADVAAYKGYFRIAESYLHRALAIAPRHARALATLVEFRKMTLDDSHWLASALEIAEQTLTCTEERDLRYAIGKYYDDVGHFDEAFRNYARANTLSKSLLNNRYVASALSAHVDSLIDACSKRHMDKAASDASMSQRPVFIVGMPRSGTSLIEQIIASHPDAFGAGELPFWADRLEDTQFAVVAASDGPAILRRFANEYLELLTQLDADAKVIIDKMPANFFYLGAIHRAFPKARIIHAQRNPIDTCLSIYFQRFSAGLTYANDLEDLAHYYSQYHRLMEHWQRVIPAESILRVPYESMIADQQRWTRAILHFVGLDWDDRCLRFHKTERAIVTASRWQARQAIYKTSIDRWRNYEMHIEPLLPLNVLCQGAETEDMMVFSLPRIRDQATQSQGVSLASYTSAR